jgi:hypothetical protein
MKKALFTLLILLGASSMSIAETTTFTQQILPIDCIYEVIDVGTQKLRYITPETCPIDPGPPIVTEPPISPVTPDSPAQSTQTTTRWVYTPPIAVMSPTAQPPKPDSSQDNKVQGTIVAIRDVIVQNADSFMLLLFIVGMWWLLLVAIIKSNAQR